MDKIHLPDVEELEDDALAALAKPCDDTEDNLCPFDDGRFGECERCGQRVASKAGQEAYRDKVAKILGQ